MPEREAVSYTPEAGDLICEQVEACIGIREICAMGLPGVPKNTATIYRWARDREEFGQQFDRAWLSRIQQEIEMTLDIADDGRNDWMERVVERDGKKKHIGWDFNHAHHKRQETQIKQRNWLAERMLPRLYGNKIEVTQKVDYASMDKDAVIAKCQEMAGKLGYKLVKIDDDA